MHADTIGVGPSGSFRRGEPGHIRIGLRLVEPEIVGRVAWFDMGPGLALLLARSLVESSRDWAAHTPDGLVDAEAFERAAEQLLPALKDMYRAASGKEWGEFDPMTPIEV